MNGTELSVNFILTNSNQFFTAFSFVGYFDYSIGMMTFGNWSIKSVSLLVWRFGPVSDCLPDSVSLAIDVTNSWQLRVLTKPFLFNKDQHYGDTICPFISKM